MYWTAVFVLASLLLDLEVICKSRNGESGNGMRGMRGMGLGMQGIGVGLQGIWMGIPGKGMRMREIWVGLWGM